MDSAARLRPILDDLGADLRYALRSWRRSPGFALMAILSLGLGIGANTIVFSVVNAFVLKPLPVADADRVVVVQGRRGPAQSFPNYREFRDSVTTFDGLVGYRISPMNLETGAAVPARAWGYLATGNYFDVLGIKPAVGRFFHQADDRYAGQSPLAVLSYDAWTTRFAADPSVVGRVIRINRTPFTIIGVAPRGFRGTEVFYRAEVWVPMM